MQTFQRRLRNTSGQVLLISIGLGLMLLLALGLVVLLNQVGSLHQVASGQKLKGGSVADEGITTAIRELSASSTTWHRALNADFTGTDCNTGVAIPTPEGSSFKLYCSTGSTGNPDLQPFQVAVRTVALATVKGVISPVRSVQAYLGQRTVGADLASGYHAAAALAMYRQPTITGDLNVHWGPIVCQDAANSWSLPNTPDTGRYPRKFSSGGISGTSVTRSGIGATAASDLKEYWAYASMDLFPVINETSYIAQAQSETGITPPHSKLSGTTILPTCTGAITDCGYFGPPNLAPGDTAVFDSGYTVPAGRPVIYVEGSTWFDSVAIDSATFIVTKSLTMANATGGGQPDLPLPITASAEYPYAPTTPATWPCQGQSGGTCPFSQVFSGRTLQFRGFLYVKGNVFINVPGWTMAGVLLIGDPLAPSGSTGQMIIPFGDSLNLAYDDTLNHAIEVNPDSANGPIKVVPDRSQIIAAF